MIAPLALALALAQGPRDTLLVNVDWLQQHQRDANLVLLQVGTRAYYDSVHIAGARFIELRDIAAPPAPGQPALELPEPARLDSALTSRGIGDDSRIVIVEAEGWFSPSTRLYLTLYWGGLGARTSILDGGLAAWRAKGGAVTTVAPSPARPARLTLHPRGDVVVTADWVLSHLSDPHVHVIDARDTRFFLGNYIPRDDQPRVGHIPGAYNLVYADMSADSLDHFRQPAALRDMFAGVRAVPGDTIVAYCHVGQQATAVWFSARLAGLDVRLYDGSFTQWSALAPARYPVER